MSKKFYADHKEVFHYTTAAGLYGIVSSKTLWASHIQFLNDTEEGVGFSRRVLPMILRSVVKPGKLTEIVELLEIAQTTAQDNYVTAFCATKDKWTAQNGLLSQWRGYGLDGGYAIVFNAKGLVDLLNTERKMYFEEEWAWGNVLYTPADLSSFQDKHNVKHFEHVRKGVSDFLETKDTKKAYPAFNSIALLSAFYKHRGFREEKEFRIFVSEPSVKVGPAPSNNSGKAYRIAHSYLRNGATVPCIHLFEDQELKALPIRRVIVGPHPEKQERKKSVEVLLRNHGIDAEVSVTDTPFHGK